MNYVSNLITANDLIIAFVIWFALLLLCPVIGKKLGTTGRRSIYIYICHTLFTFIFLVYANKNGADAINYIWAGEAGNFRYRIGTDFVKMLCSLFSWFGMSIISMFLIFQFWGAIGIIAIDAVLKSFTIKGKYKVFIVSILPFTPSLHFWSSAVGKDSIALLSVGLLIWAVREFYDRKLMFLIAVLIMATVRPHISALMIFSLGGAFVVNSEKLTLKRIIIILAIIAVTYFGTSMIVSYVGLSDGLSLSKIQEYIDIRQNLFQKTSGTINIRDMSYPMQIVTYLFRPLPFEAHNISALIASFDNSIFLGIAIYTLFKSITSKRQPKKLKVNSDKIFSLFLWAYAISGTTVLALTTANMGIAVRQKWMVVPMILCLLIFYMRNKSNYGFIEHGVFQPKSSTNKLKT